jgi:hypothetical protein
MHIDMCTSDSGTGTVETARGNSDMAPWFYVHSRPLSRSYKFESGSPFVCALFFKETSGWVLPFYGGSIRG